MDDAHTKKLDPYVIYRNRTNFEENNTRKKDKRKKLIKKLLTRKRETLFFCRIFRTKESFHFATKKAKNKTI